MSPPRSAPLALEHVLLALLDAQPMHGYELYQELAATRGIALIWNITQSTLYALLDKLESRGLLASTLVQAEAYPPRKVFHITPAGRSALREWIKTPVRRPRQTRQEFLAKLIVARRYGTSQALGLIQAQRQACQDWMEQLRAGFPPRDAEHMDTWVVFSYRVHRLEAVLQWLDLCAEELTGEKPSA